ncbi:hypothetical protein C7974DRAFT_53299 [Boeremia exigua]|uniref:uncharacterized protein n=1 Tax=Boeremia exigua TaxID=749465 RepID=UPI001E8E4047|nr:uncharacterized protein C7974DRAFT_53299 [Boeremia exigua]KAH6616835.1 hypothetical protein C7974DRAFT_53299 [Boeremia exigua]
MSAESNTTPIGAPCWAEIMASDPQKLKEFYATLFPAWRFTTIAPDTHAEVAHFKFEQLSRLSGGIVKLPDGCPTPGDQPTGIGFTVYFYVDSINEIDAKITVLGGTKTLPKTPESEHGFFANFKDPEGNRFGVYERKVLY